jgi:hypothetical protein
MAIISHTSCVGLQSKRFFVVDYESDIELLDVSPAIALGSQATILETAKIAVLGKNGWKVPDTGGNAKEGTLVDFKYKTYTLPLGEGGRVYTVECSEMHDVSIRGWLSCIKPTDPENLSIAITPLPPVDSNVNNEASFWIDPQTDELHVMLYDTDRYNCTAWVTFVYVE